MRVPSLIELGRRPDEPRYVWIMVGAKNVHTGATWRGLEKATLLDKPHLLYLVDLHKQILVFVREDVKAFLAKWRQHYFDTSWDYMKEIGA